MGVVIGCVGVVIGCVGVVIGCVGVVIGCVGVVIGCVGVVTIQRGCFIFSGRRLFEYERKPKEISPPSSARPGHRDVAENGKEAKATEGSNEEEGSPPTQIKDTERKEIFAARQKLSEWKGEGLAELEMA